MVTRRPLGWRARIAALNVILARELVGEAGTTFLDIGECYLVEQGWMALVLTPDVTHPSEEGCGIWGRVLVESGLLPAP
ncbi:MAG: hypothetical protein IPL39_01195 [Opitutaceae bacterium]|nr:hypothetical protein [Opitutaceae bacterium]